MTPGGPLVSLSNNGPSATITFRQRVDAPAHLVPEFSPNLGANGAWSDIRHLELDRVEVEPGILEITVRAPLGFENAPAHFYRLAAQLP